MSFYAGDIRCCGFDFAPQGWLLCDGQTLPVSEYPELFATIGDAFGGDGVKTFCVPDLQARAPMHAGQDAEGMQYTRGQSGGLANVTLQLDQLPTHGHISPAMTNLGGNVSPEAGMYAANEANLYNPVATGNSGLILAPWGGSQAHDNLMPYLTVNYIIAVCGGEGGEGHEHAGMVAWFASTSLPKGWVPCDGQTFGRTEEPGEGYVPDLRGRFCLGASAVYGPGQMGGEATHTLTIAEMPQHYHTVQACGGPPDAVSPVGNFPAAFAGAQGPLYGTGGDTSLGLSNAVGMGLPHENRPPFLVLLAGVASPLVEIGDPWLGEIRLFAADNVPEGWARCDGKAMSIRTNVALHSLLAGRFGSNATDFFLPDLRGRIAQGPAQGTAVGTTGGETSVMLATAQMPAHGHSRQVSTDTYRSQDAPAPDTYVTQSGGRTGFLQLYATPDRQATTPVAMIPSAAVGGGQAHNNMAPFVALNACMCLAGLYPARP